MALGFVAWLGLSPASPAGRRCRPLSVLVLLPAFLLAGDWLASARPRARFAYLALSGSLLILASILYTLWFFLG